MNAFIFVFLILGASGQSEEQEPVAEPSLEDQAPLASLKAFAAVPLERSNEIRSNQPPVPSTASVPSKFRSNFVTKGQKSIAEIGGHVSQINPSPVEVVDVTGDLDAIPLSPNCPTHFGLYEVQGSCRKYYHCRLGIDYVSECPSNTVFEVAAETCVHPDQSSRTECSGPSVHQFECPRYNLVNGYLPLLRFGDHDRLPHPSDCSKFFACLLNGQPRLASCPKPTAFSPETGFCTDYKMVKGCEGLYVEEPKEEVRSGGLVQADTPQPGDNQKFFNFANSI